MFITYLIDETQFIHFSRELILHSNLSLSLSLLRGDIDVKFPIVSPERLKVPVSYLEMENTIKQTKWKKDQTMEDLKREQALLDHAMFDFETKKLEFIRYLSESSPQGSQVTPQSCVIISLLNNPNLC